MPLLQRRPAEWKEIQLGVVHHFNGSRLQGRGDNAAQTAQQKTDSTEKTTKKRKLKADDETAVIDDLFADATKEKTSKKSKI